MTILHNEITINAPIERVWAALSNIEELEKYDPTVLKSTAITSTISGIGAARKVDMRDGKNWFEEKCTDFKVQESLAYELTDCSFPIHALSHRYSFENIEGKVKVKQVMQYQMKFGFLGKIMDALMVKKQTGNGIKAFMEGLKSFTENT
ncbi:MAG: SRPBCC family protein [Saprospiraceae bacterium]|nr:SRPBCC family protein [Saprospiraceae bacterium]